MVLHIGRLLFSTTTTRLHPLVFEMLVSILDAGRRGTCKSGRREGNVKHELEKLYGHIDEIEIAMMTTRRDDGHLQSRAMATQKRAEGADLWFVTLAGTEKLHDLS